MRTSISLDDHKVRIGRSEQTYAAQNEVINEHTETFKEHTGIFEEHTGILLAPSLITGTPGSSHRSTPRYILYTA